MHKISVRGQDYTIETLYHEMNVIDIKFRELLYVYFNVIILAYIIIYEILTHKIVSEYVLHLTCEHDLYSIR